MIFCRLCLVKYIIKATQKFEKIAIKINQSLSNSYFNNTCCSSILACWFFLGGNFDKIARRLFKKFISKQSSSVVETFTAFQAFQNVPLIPQAFLYHRVLTSSQQQGQVFNNIFNFYLSKEYYKTSVVTHIVMSRLDSNLFIAVISWLHIIKYNVQLYLSGKHFTRILFGLIVSIISPQVNLNQCII